MVHGIGSQGKSQLQHQAFRRRLQRVGNFTCKDGLSHPCRRDGPRFGSKAVAEVDPEFGAKSISEKPRGYSGAT